MYSSRKIKKLMREPKLFFKDAFLNNYRIANKLINNFKAKKYKAYSKYAIISAVYNVEKYLDDFFKSIINQRLDFKNNIYLICVDDGSTDNSAQIIKKYQKKYPKNIIYLYKENGGQASARNLGLKYLKENDLNITWLTFTDPDDFLDRNYFYEVDKFLAENKHEDISMIGCNMIFYYEPIDVYRAHHLNFKFKKNFIIENKKLDLFIQVSIGSTFIFYPILNEIQFDESLKPVFEDAKFINQYLLSNICFKSVFLKNSKYYYRKRGDKQSSTQISSNTLELYLDVSKNGVLSLINYSLQLFGDTKQFIQNVCLYHYMWQIRDIVNCPEKLYFMNTDEKKQYLKLIDKIFSYIDAVTIINFNLARCWFFHKVGILNCFKKEKPPFQIVYIEDYDPYKEQILLTYYTGDREDVESILINGQELYADYEKIVEYDFLDRVFCYQKRLWIHIPYGIEEYLEIYINNVKARITFNGKKYKNIQIKDIQKEFQKRLLKSNIWLLMDRDYEADDNAEHLYRYIMQNHPEQKIIFALRKESSDWNRLKQEGFNLVEFGGNRFKKIIYKCNKIISSHLDSCLMQYVVANQMCFVNLQHGVTFATDVSKWLNSYPQIKFMTLCNIREYNNISMDNNRYIISKKEAKLVGFARHDRLLEISKKDNKIIFIMPTWRKYIVGNVINNTGIREFNYEFLKSDYFIKWKSLLNNKKLRDISQKYGYKIIFFPHFQSRLYLEYFNIPSYISIDARNDGESLQKVFSVCDLMITDYSTASSEMAIQNKPTLYYQFDEEEINKGIHHQRERNFDFRNHGYGPVVATEQKLIDRLEKLLQDNCQLEQKYKKRIEQDFAFKDGKCCERIYKAILELNRPYERKYTLDYVLTLANNAFNKEYFNEASQRYKYVLEHLEDKEFIPHSIKLNEELIFNYLYSSRINNVSDKAIEFINAQNYENIINLGNKTKLEIIKNYISIDNVYESVQRLKNFEIPKEEQKEFTLIQLKAYFYLGCKDLFKKTYEELQNTYNISEFDLRNEILFLQNYFIKNNTRKNIIEAIFQDTNIKRGLKYDI